MQPLHQRVGAGVVITLLVAAPQTWGQQLPLTAEEKRAFLESAEVIEAEQTSKGVTQPWRLTLTNGTLTHAGVFQSVDQQKAKQRLGNTQEFNFVDSYRYNIAAYELAVLIGLGDMVPVTVERRWNGKTGALSWWIDDVMFDEATRQDSGRRPDDIAAWSAQMGRMVVFEELVHDNDRNKTNILYTGDWKLYMIDFSRAFRLWDQLRRPQDLVRIDASLFERLQSLTNDAVHLALGSILTGGEMDGIMKRRDRLVQHFEDLIDRKGEALVLN